MDTKKIIKIFSIILLVILASATAVMSASTNPSKPTAITVKTNTTTAYPMGEMLNKTRGYIYTLELNESQPSQKWVGYVGHVAGEYALQDADGNALYDWDIATVTGEIYATKETTYAAVTEANNPYAGGIPEWTNISCANEFHLKQEGNFFNHDYTDEDAYNNTFKADTFALTTFYAGERQVTDTTMFNSTTSTHCFGINLNQNNADVAQGGDWEEVVLTDGTWQWTDGTETARRWDIIYAVLLENDTVGYNGSNFDFQMILPQKGGQGAQENIAFYFYAELI